MSANTTTAVQRALGATEEELSALKAVRLVWKKLETLRLKAEKGTDRELTAYKELLEQNLVSVRKALVPDDFESLAKGFWEWYGARTIELGIAGIERNRGKEHQEWCGRWLPAEFSAFCAAISKTIETPSQVNFEEAKIATDKMLRAYVEAFEKT